MISDRLPQIPLHIRLRVNRALIVLCLAALLGGVFLEQWRAVLLNAILLCYSCIGLG